MTENMFNLKKAITWEHSGKMIGMASLSTSCLDNPHCIKRKAIKGCICSKCYADTLQRCRPTNGRKFIRNGNNNGDDLKHHILTDAEIRKCKINRPYFRFEAFGDLETTIQVRNYFQISKLNPKVQFALWTKNPWIISNALKEKMVEGVPKNLQIVYSSPMINQKVPYDAIKRIYPFVNKVFTVYDKDFAAEHDIKINCGARCCLTCLRCYKSRTAHEVNELLH